MGQVDSITAEYANGRFAPEERRFVLLGIRGQMIFVDPATKLVMVHTAVRPQAVDRTASAETVALWLAAVDQLGRSAQ
jgi:CubicO group peptidase (beta-lactamase class C family)